MGKGAWEKLDDGKSSEKKEILTIDEVVDRIYKGVNFKLLLLFITATGTNTQTAAQVYMTIFTGFIPYSEWTCVSDRCFSLLAESNFSETFYSARPMCANQLVAGTDFNWTSQRTSFSMDWGIYCESESKLSVVSSFFFIGAFLGLVSSTAIFDRFGRKNGAIAGNIIAGIATVVGTWAPSFEVMLAIRVLQGIGMFMNLTGIYCWVVEFSPTHLRGSLSALILIMWSLGYLVIVLIGYLIHSWKYIFLTTGTLNFLLIIPLLIYPISPRFALVRGREEEAKRILKEFSQVCNNEGALDMDRVDLSYTTKVQNYADQFKDFMKYPTLRKQTLLCFLCWFTVAFLFYGFDFGWGKISSNLYASYLLAALGKVFSFTITIPAGHFLGRKKSVQFFLVLGVIFFFLAMPDLQISEDWTLEFAACLVGSIVTSSAYAINYLYTSELAPTTHRGTVMSLSSSCARLGSFSGIYATLLYDITDRRVPLALFAGMTMTYVVAVSFLTDTTDKSIPETPQDVEIMAGKEKYHSVESGTGKKRLESV